MTGFNRRKNMRKNNLIHPGEILREEFMIPMKISQNRLALAIGVPATRVGEIVNERRAITADTAIRLGTYFKTGPEFWLNLQTNYDLGVAYSEKEQEYELIRM
jgi:addiction module HigA family antidote